MKTIVALFALCFVSTLAHHGTNNEKKGLLPPKIKAYFEECMFENGLSKETFKEIKTQGIKGKMQAISCAVACMHEKLDLVDENGKIKIDAYEKTVKNLLAAMGKTYDPEMKDVIIRCTEMTDDITERCQKFMAHSKCVVMGFIDIYRKKHGQ